MATLATSRILPKCSAYTPSRYIRAAELINGRSAMLGFTAGAGKFIMNGEPLLRQIQDPGQDLGAVLIVAAVAVGTFLTLDERLGMTDTTTEPWTPDAELLNGRVAMMGVLSLALTV